MDLCVCVCVCVCHSGLGQCLLLTEKRFEIMGLFSDSVNGWSLEWMTVC